MRLEVRMLTFIAFVIIFVTVCYGIGSLLGDHQERIKERNRSMANGRVDYSYNGKQYVGDRRAFLISRNGRDVLVDAADTSKVLYDLTTREEGRLRQKYLKREEEAKNKAIQQGKTWFYVPSSERGQSSNVGPWLRKDIATGRLFTVTEMYKMYLVEYYILTNPVGTDRMNYIKDESNPKEWITKEEYLKRYVPKSPEVSTN